MSNNLIGATLAIFTVTLSAAVTEPVDVAWSTRDGTAKSGTDYEAANGVITFLPGETAKQVQVTVYGQDDLTAADKNFYIELSPPSNAVLGVTLIEVVISIDEEDGVAVLSLVVPQGKRGLKGDPGLSAYEHAVLMGYEGTIEQWMAEIADAEQAASRAEGFAADAAESAVVAQQKAGEAVQAVASTKQYVDGALSNLSTEANKFYPTLAAANADIANIQLDQPVTVGEAVNGGLWYKATSGATTLTKSPYDSVEQAKNYADANPFFKPVSIQSNVHLDSFVSDGNYYRLYNTPTTPELGYPYPSRGLLQVFSFNESLKMQKYSPMDANLSFMRVMTDGVNWQAWQKNASQSDIDQIFTQSVNYTDQIKDSLSDDINNTKKDSRDLIDILAQEVSRKLLNSTDDGVLNVVDMLDNIVFRIDKDGRLYAVGLDTDVISTINDNSVLVQQVAERLYTQGIEDVLNVADSYDSVVFRIDKDAKIHVVGLDDDLVSVINRKSETGLAIVDTSNLANYSYKDTFEQSAQSLLNFSHSQDVGLYAPTPLGMFKQNFTVSSDWLDDAVIDEFPSWLPMNTPYGTNRGVVHPHLLEFPNGFNGYRYLLGITGYTNGNTREENPFIYGSNDLQSFDLLTGILDEPESYTWEKGVTYNSDIVMFYDPKTLELCVTWRRYLADTSGVAPNQTSETIYCIRTKDLKTWSEKEVIFYRDATILPNEVCSPVFLFDVKSDTWHMYAPSGTRAVNSIRHFTAKKLHRDAWTLQGTITALPVGSLPWHLDGRFIGDRVALLVQDREPGTSRGVGMRLGISDPDSYTDFTWASKYMDDVPNRLECYKGTFVPHFDEDDNMAITYMWTTNSNESDKYKLLIKTTPFFDAGVTVK